jgi:hypothetical protein
MNQDLSMNRAQRLNYLIETVKADRLSMVLVKLNQWILIKLLQEKHTTEELKFL